MSTKRTADATQTVLTDKGDLLTITPLGSGQEVGRSCHLLTYKKKVIMLDCGIHPGRQGMDALPYFDEVDPATIDVLIVTHFHLDHIASLPYFTEKTTFKGRIFMTHPTKAVYKWLLSDFVKVSNISTEDMLFDEHDLDSSMDKIETMDFHQTVEIDGIKFTAYNAGHVLGAAMIELEIAGVKILYTGDYSREEDRHLMAAEKPPTQPHILIIESTYGVQVHEPREEREARFTTTIHKTVARGGRVLIPVFALGRAQELLLILDEYWKAHPELHSIPIYYASALAKKCMSIYQTYIHMMNDKIRREAAVSNPFVFQHISNLRSMAHFDDVGPCVIMASPGFLQSGISRELFEMWCPNPKNTCLIAGYAVEGTLAKHVMSEPTEITAMNGHKLPLRMEVRYISFAAHADYSQTRQFIDELRPPHIVLVHGQANEMMRLQQALVRQYEDRADISMMIHTPKNTQTVELYFRGEKKAKVIGTLAAETPVTGHKLSGILVKKGFTHNLLEASELQEYTELCTSTVLQRQQIEYRTQLSLLQYYLEQMYGPVETKTVDGHPAIKVSDAVLVIQDQPTCVTIEWPADAVNDMVADSVIAAILQVESNPHTVKLVGAKCSHGHVDAHELTEAEIAAAADELAARKAEKMTEVKEENTDNDSKNGIQDKLSPKSREGDTSDGDSDDQAHRHVSVTLKIEDEELDIADADLRAKHADVKSEGVNGAEVSEEKEAVGNQTAGTPHAEDEDDSPIDHICREEFLEQIERVFGEQFESVERQPDGTMRLAVQDNVAVVNLSRNEVDTSDGALRARATHAINRTRISVTPIDLLKE